MLKVSSGFFCFLRNIFKIFLVIIDSPFRCKILDAEKVMFQPLEKVAVNKVAQITVDTNGGLLNENSIVILSNFFQKKLA